MADADWTSRNELNSLLRACRSRLVGPSVPGSRRGRKMSQVYVAGLAGITSRHYSEIERGEFTPPAELVDRLAAALKMTDAERSAFHVLATGQDPPRKVAGPETEPPPQPDQALRDLVAQMSHIPAALTDETWTLNYCNQRMNLMSGGWFDASPEDRNLISYLFSAHAESVLPDVRLLRRTSIAAWRYQYARNISSPRFHDAVARLTGGDAEAAALWEMHEVAFPPHQYPVRVRAPRRGSLIEAQVVFVPVSPHKWLYSMVLPGGPVPGQGPRP